MKDDRSAETATAAAGYKNWICTVCGWIYGEEAGSPEEGVPALTRLTDIPDDWRCPLCGVGKADFVPVAD